MGRELKRAALGNDPPDMALLMRAYRMTGMSEKWSLLFFDGCSVEVYETNSADPQADAIQLIAERPELLLIAAVSKLGEIMIRDSARTAECGMESVSESWRKS